MNRYRQLAQSFRQQIESKTWRAGEKLPSVRMACKHHGVSAGTVLQAYQLLEAQGWVIAKPQSGYFVTSDLQRLTAPREPFLSALPSFSDELYDFLKDQSESQAVKLGSAFPDVHLFPLEALNRNLASAGRKMSANDLLNNLPPGNEALRRLIAQRYIQQGMDLTHHDIVMTSGAMEALNLSLQVVTKPGDTIVVESPCFYGALQAAQRLGLNVIEVDVDERDGLNLEQFEHVLANNEVKACWLMSNFQNPTGVTLSEQKKQAVVELVHRYQLYLIEDDVYSELYYSQDKPSSFKTYDREDRVLHCGSLSKSLCPGYRLGWVVTRRFNHAIQKLQLTSTLSGSAPIQQGVAYYLQNDGYDKHLRKLRSTLKQRQQRMMNELRRQLPDTVQFSSPTGGYFLWLKLPESIQARQVYTQLKQQGVLSAYGGLFSQTKRFDHYLRINCSLPESDDLVQAIRCLAVTINRLATD
ncbi:TPA: PLP-dependent aminotransferase family protein [Vibrio vulnificus]|nr:PLP-dependent aminotransferase family protein [Vibrio vulnificus]HAS8508623.1 PLP-dependent aminotransferase family protein [Vibrio vulnificus]